MFIFGRNLPKNTCLYRGDGGMGVDMGVGEGVVTDAGGGKGLERGRAGGVEGAG